MRDRYDTQNDERRPEPQGFISRYWWVILGGILFLMFCIFAPMSCYNVGAGEVGVEFDPLAGGVQPQSTGEGLHLKAPWVSIDKFNVKMQEYTMAGTDKASKADDFEMVTTTSEQLSLELDVTLQYYLPKEKAPVMRQDVGKDGEYQKILVIPSLRSVIRSVVAKHTAVEIMGDSRDTVANLCTEAMRSILGPQNIKVVSVLLRKTEPPALLKEAISLKKQAEQDAQRMEYVLQKETQERERKQIEAQGIAKANEIIAGSLTPQYLSWYWLEKLKDHNDVIYVPTDGLFPMFKNVDSGLPNIPEKKNPTPGKGAPVAPPPLLPTTPK